MALPPSIPTSFVPRQTSSAGRVGRIDLAGAFTFVAFIIFIIAVGAAIAVFAYQRYLLSEESSQNAALTKAEQSIDQNTVDNFVRLRERLTSGETLLDSHVAYSNFLNLLGTLTPTTVGFSSLTLTTNPDGSATLALSGTAASFNSLAAESLSIATDSRIKDAVFSDIAINPNGSVNFSIAATLDPSLVAIPASGAIPPAVTAATSTATTTP